MKIFVSYTSSDRDWAHWIGWQLRKAGHEAFVHEWEIGPGENIPRWMEERLDQAKALLGVFSDDYCKAIYSQSERWAAYWQDPAGRSGFLIPVEVTKVTKWPTFISPLKRLTLVGSVEADALRRLLEFLSPPKPPTEKPAFPGVLNTDPKEPTPFTVGGDTIGNAPPSFPAPPSPVPSPQTIIDPETLIRCIDDHEPKPQIFGREEEIETIAGVFLTGKIVFVAGGPGMGKTAVATAAIYDPRVVAHFGRRRVFASLETANEARAILAKLIEALGLTPTGDEVSLMRILETYAAETPFAAIIDNAETVFDTDRVGSERLFSLVGGIEGLSLAITIRGVTPPLPDVVSIDDLPKLSASSARDAFLAVAGATFKDDPDLAQLLQALDGHALSIRLVAAQGIGLPSLKGLRESWDDAHAKILRISGETESRLTSVRASLALSLNSRRMKATPLARRLLALLAFLPAGLAEANVRAVLGERGALTAAKATEAVVCLHQLRLVERRPDLRLRMLTPLRESIKGSTPPVQIDKDRLIERYLEIAVTAGKAGTIGWNKSREEVEAEADNLDALCELAVRANFTHRLLQDALDGLAAYHAFSGRGAVGSIAQAASRSRSESSRVAGRCIARLGYIAFARSDFESARANFDEALRISQRSGLAEIQADCIKSLGDLALVQSELETARGRYQEALTLFRKCKHLQGETNCMFKLGDIALAWSDHDLAREYYESAQVYYPRVGSLVGEANCIVGLGAIASRKCEYDKAIELFESALKLYRDAGSAVGEANCIFYIAQIARWRFHYEPARKHCEEALILYRRMGNVFNEASCLREFGRVEYALSHFDRATARYQQALALQRRVGNVLGEAETMILLGKAQEKAGDVRGLDNVKAGFSQYFGRTDARDRAQSGWKATKLAVTSTDEAESDHQRALARSAWTAVGRLDLVRDWVDLP